MERSQFIYFVVVARLCVIHDVGDGWSSERPATARTEIPAANRLVAPRRFEDAKLFSGVGELNESLHSDLKLHSQTTESTEGERRNKKERKGSAPRE